jgi:hypothetical protein
MTGPGWDDDDRLLEDLRAAVVLAGPPTETMIAAGEAAFSFRTIDAELAALTYDSLLDESMLVRSTGAPPRTLVFEGSGLSVELGLTPDALVGQLVPPVAGEVAIFTLDGEVARTSTDELGCFTLARPDRELARLHCWTTSTALLTDWVKF